MIIELKDISVLEDKLTCPGFSGLPINVSKQYNNMPIDNKMMYVNNSPIIGKDTYYSNISLKRYGVWCLQNITTHSHYQNKYKTTIGRSRNIRHPTPYTLVLASQKLSIIAQD